MGQVLAWLVGAWTVYVTFGSVVFVLWTRRSLRHDPVRWLRRRGVSCPDESELEVLWLEGQLGFPNYLRIPVVAAVLTADQLVLECQVTTFFRRGRLTVPINSVLRVKDGSIADPRRRCLVASRPPERLLALLEERGWTLEDVPF